MSARIHAVITLALLACPACTHAEDEDEEFRATPVSTGGTSSGTVFNTHQIEDGAFSELSQPGLPSLGVALQSVVLDNGVEVAELDFRDGEIVAIDDHGKRFGGTALVESTWNLESWLLWGTPVSMRIGAMTRIGGVPHYDFQHLVGKTWVHNCASQGKGPSFARMLWGFTLDERTGDIEPAEGNAFIACSDAAVGKAASWGYYGQAKMSGHYHALETAIRVVRADYCYDGGSHTKAGTPVQVEDVWGYRAITDEAMPIEAVWGADGLLCAGHPRGDVDIYDACPGLDVDPCKPGATLTDDPGALFLTRVPVVVEEILPAPGHEF
jgi:hypothetical protein